jgi:ATP-dependent Lon protease
MLLSGPPGVGKTLYATSLGELLETPVVETQVSTLSADFSLGGLDSSYESAKPGVVWDALDGETMSPMIVLDELDKLPPRSDGALGCLYRLLERHSAKRFADQAILLPVDASHIQWIATCNDPDAVEPALRSRFHLIEIRPPTAEQRAATVCSVNKALLRDSVWASAFDGRLSSSVIERLGDLSPRLVRQTLELAYARAALAGRRRIEVKDLEGLRTTFKRAIGFV